MLVVYIAVCQIVKQFCVVHFCLWYFLFLAKVFFVICFLIHDFILFSTYWWMAYTCPLTIKFFIPRLANAPLVTFGNIAAAIVDAASPIDWSHKRVAWSCLVNLMFSIEACLGVLFWLIKKCSIRHQKTFVYRTELPTFELQMWIKGSICVCLSYIKGLCVEYFCSIFCSFNS